MNTTAINGMSCDTKQETSVVENRAVCAFFDEVQKGYEMQDGGSG